MKKIISILNEYISEECIRAVIKLCKFLIIYTIGFLILMGSFKYAVPFVIALFIAVLLRPVKEKILKINNNFKKARITNSFAAMILTLTIVILSVLSLSGILWVIVSQIEKFLVYITNPDTLNEVIQKSEIWASSILSQMHQLDPEIMEKINSIIKEIVTLGTNAISILGKKLLSAAVSIPTAIISIFITLIATYFFMKDIEVIEEKVKKIFSPKGLKYIKDIKEKLNSVSGGYVKAYALIMLSIAVLSYLIFRIAKVQYALPIAIITAVLDLLPLIGAGMVYGILIISMYLAGNTLSAVILLIGYIIVAIIRQLLEQNLVASFIGIHPLMMIIALFIALTPLGFTGMFYFLGAIILYDII